MPQVLLDLPEETYQRLKERAQAMHLSIRELLTRQIIQDFVFLINTAHQAKQLAEEWLHAHAGLLLKAGKPAFEENGQVWRVPVVTNVRSKECDLVGEVHIDARTGHFLESEDTMEMLEKTRQAFGLSRVKTEQQSRLNEILELNRTRKLTPQEEKELDLLMQQVREQTDANLERLASILTTRRYRHHNPAAHASKNDGMS
ncbi:MAG: hypothetical protein H8D67_05910 [Deltaproteobacteria bacterium]|nr:hypothetical protein [Deltaproteobacteria bacterium]